MHVLDADLAGVDVVEAVQQPRQRALARARGADDRDVLAGRLGTPGGEKPFRLFVAAMEIAASVLVLKKALDTQAAGAVQLIQSLPQPALATSGALGTRVNTYA